MGPLICTRRLAVADSTAVAVELVADDLPAQSSQADVDLDLDLDVDELAAWRWRAHCGCAAC